MSGRSRISLALTLLLLCASTVKGQPRTGSSDPMLGRLLRGHGVGVDTMGGPVPPDRSELEYYSRFLAVDPAADPPAARLRMRLDDAARRAVERLGFPVYGRLDGFASVVVPIARIPELDAIPGIEWMQIVRRPRTELDLSIPVIGADQAAAAYGTRGQGVIVGLVDTGVDWRHQDFRNANGTTRIKFLWDQTEPCPPGVGATPAPPFDFGCQYTESDINAALGGGPAITFRDGQGHGTHVLGAAAGNGRGTGPGQPPNVYVGVASKASLIVVKIFPEAGVGCTNCYDIGLGLDMIDAKAADFGMPYVVNLSLGSDLGGHDGSDLDERTIDLLTGPGKPGKAIVKSAGNSRGYGIHVSGTVAAGGQNDHTFTIPPYTPLSGIFNDLQAWEMWYRGGDAMTVTILDPPDSGCPGVNNVSSSTGQGQHDLASSSGTMIISDVGSPAVNGARFFDMEIDDQSGSAPCSGTWTFRVHGDTITQGGHYDMWIYFSSFGASGLYSDWNAPDYTGLVSIPGTAQYVTTVGAFVTKTGWVDIDNDSIGYNPPPAIGSLAPFSSPGPTRDGRIKPEISAPGMGVASTLSADAAPAALASPSARVRVLRDGVHWILEGTSMSAPHVAGVYAQMLALNRNLDATQLRTLITSTAATDGFTTLSVPNSDWGYGKLKAYAATQMLVKDIPTLTAGLDGYTFSWSAVPTADTYNIYRGDLGAFGAASYGTCFRQGLSSPAFVDIGRPATGHTFTYLATGVRAGIEGILGFRSDGTVRQNNAPCP